MHRKSVILAAVVMLPWLAACAEVSGRVFSLRTGKAQAGAIVRLVGPGPQRSMAREPITVKVVVEGYKATPGLVVMQMGDTLALENAGELGCTVLLRFRENRERSVLLYAKGHPHAVKSFTLEKPELFATFADELGNF
ncbi:MAG TPA: hypothetical protein VK968_02190, partial [Roseimicrobium sp.]|nr:hypothetical protein [Roseimicrobium sp.]